MATKRTRRPPKDYSNEKPFLERFNSSIFRTMRGINEKCYAITRELFLSIVELTPSPSNPGPWAEGLLANQWYPNIGTEFSTALTTAASTDGGGSKARILAMKGKEFYRKDGAVTLANNVEYAYRAEKRGWPKIENMKETGWTGNIGPYLMIARSVQYISRKYRIQTRK